MTRGALHGEPNTRQVDGVDADIGEGQVGGPVQRAASLLSGAKHG
jgi:hypothetical protein